ncbi:MAG: dynamin family protein [Bacteroides sp.]|nr:dynamin family protein [Bacteroides sp.]
MEINTQLMEFNKRRETLLSIVSETARELDELNLDIYSENMEKLRQKMSSDTFKIMVMGNFKNGKSTFINSLLGQEVLPAYAAPATAIINEVKYGENKSAVLYFRNPVPPVDDNVAEQARIHIKNHGTDNVPPMSIPVDSMEDFLVIPLGMERNEASLKSPYEKAELFWPLELLKNNVEIVDSPGLNEDPERTAITLSYLKQADAILFTFDATHFVSHTELEYIDITLAELGFDKKSIFGVVNRFDQLTNERDRAQIKGLVEKTLKNRTEHIFYTAARSALEGKTKGNGELLASSGIPELEETLADYLANDRGRIKLSSPAKELLHILRGNVLNTVIPQRRGIYSTELAEVKEKYEKRKPDIDGLKTERELILTKLQSQITLIKNDVSRFVTNYLNEFPTLVNSWITQYSPETKYEMLHPKISSEKLVQEITEYINKRIDNEFRSWSTGPLTTFICEKTDQLKDSMQGRIEEFYVKLDEIMFDISGVEQPKDDIPTWKRVVAATGGMLLSGWSGMIVGTQEGLNKSFAITVAKQLAINISAILVSSLVAVFINPIAMIGALAAPIVQTVSALKGQGSRAEKLAKDKVAEAYCNLLNEQAPELSKSISDKAMEQVSMVRELAGDALSAEITQMEEQLKEIIDEMEEGEENIKLLQEKLNTSEANIRGLENRLTEFVFELLK